jgi:integrase
LVSLTNAAQPLERVHARVFDVGRLAASTPVILTGAMAGWKALDTCLRTLTAFRKKRMAFAELVERAEQADASGVHYYLTQRPIATEFPEVLDDVETPLWIAGRTRDQSVARLGRKTSRITAHGFRSSFRDWASERTNAPRAVCEAALGHSINDTTEAAYHRSDLFERRRHVAIG